MRTHIIFASADKNIKTQFNGEMQTQFTIEKYTNSFIYIFLPCLKNKIYSIVSMLK